MVTLLGNVPVAGKFEQMVVPGSAICWRKWKKLQAVAETEFTFLRAVASAVVDSTRVLFFYVSRKRVTVRDWRKTSAGAS